jgi:hypothetical protein
MSRTATTGAGGATATHSGMVLVCPKKRIIMCDPEKKILFVHATETNKNVVRKKKKKSRHRKKR